jgi:hypothetical protein
MFSHTGHTAIIIGNGPSLNDVPKELLDKYITFGSNKIYALPYLPDYYCIIDENMLANCLPTIKAGWRPKRQMFLRAEACVEDNYPIYPIVINGFGLDINNFVVMGGTVTFAMLQIAFWMDFKTVLLVGVDHYYPKSFTGEPELFEAKGEDPDHFVCENGKPYFTPGEKYSRPEDTTTAYMIADNVYGQAGKKIINLTPGTKLDVFEKGVYLEWQIPGS